MLSVCEGVSTKLRLCDSPLELEEFWAPVHVWDFRDRAACFVAPELTSRSSRFEDTFAAINTHGIASSLSVKIFTLTCANALQTALRAVKALTGPRSRLQYLTWKHAIQKGAALPLYRWPWCIFWNCSKLASVTRKSPVVSNHQLWISLQYVLPLVTLRLRRSLTRWSTCNADMAATWQGQVPDPNGARVQMNLKRFPLFLFSFSFSMASNLTKL